ncbi:MAG: 30S ribosomal protein S20 [Myxococcales bacterium]|nr:30S ribosomal protein S20 [Myxococcales bacterium]
MAHHKSAIKRIRTSAAANERNRGHRTRVKNAVKAMRATLATGDAAASAAQLNETVSTLQKMARKGTLHRKTASRRISRLAKAANALKK